MNKSNSSCRLLLLLAVLSTAALGQVPYDIDAEIAKVKRELVKVQSERRLVAKDLAEDRRDFETYRERNATRVAAVNAEADSIRALSRTVAVRNDSLGAAIEAIESSIRQQGLQQARLRQLLVAQCDSFISFASGLPPLLAGQSRGTLDFLKSELQSGSVENIEAVQRLTQIIRELDAFSGEIQVVEGASVIPDIRGTTYRLRIGSFFEAIVDSRGEKAAVWIPEPGRWEMLESQSSAATLLKAVRMREGKSLPTLVDIDLSRPVQQKEATHE